MLALVDLKHFLCSLLSLVPVGLLAIVGWKRALNDLA
jgi:hypothetical protein